MRAKGVRAGEPWHGASPAALPAIMSHHVSVYLEESSFDHATSSVKRHLAPLRMLAFFGQVAWKERAGDWWAALAVPEVVALGVLVLAVVYWLNQYGLPTLPPGRPKVSSRETYGPAHGGVWRPAPNNCQSGNQEVIPGLFLSARSYQSMSRADGHRAV
jgi:hypothetical protein